jgi:hypothetical protein
MASKSRIIYIPSFDDVLIQRKELYDFDGEPEWEYFTSFVEAKRQMVSYWQNTLSEAQLFLKEARKLKIGDCC